jgi:hypothetical protein
LLFSLFTFHLLFIFHTPLPTVYPFFSLPSIHCLRLYLSSFHPLTYFLIYCTLSPVPQLQSLRFLPHFNLIRQIFRMADRPTARHENLHTTRKIFGRASAT